MRLKSLELVGFKSFAKKGDLHFDTPITAIVGPNGSGKSNIAEGFRFVLGEQSIKSLRGKKGEDLIFNGAKNAPKSNRASVKVVFDNTDRLFSGVDFDEISIERVVHRDGSNDYFINKSAVRLKDIGELLSAANIGSSGHHIISQGEADRILNASPKERREMIEDALGLKIYQYKRAESERKLAKTEENVKSVESLRREIAPHIRFLKKQVQKIEKAAEMRDELAGLYQEYLVREDSYIQGEGARIEKETEPLEEEKVSLEKSVAEAKRVIAESEQASEGQGKIIELETRIHKARDERNELVRRLGRVEGSLDAYARDMERRAKSATTDTTISQKEVQDVLRDIKRVIDAVKSDADISVFQDTFARIAKTIDTFSATLATTKSDISEEDRETHKQLQAEKVEIEKAMQSLQETEEKLAREMEGVREELDRGRTESREAERTLFEAMTRQSEVTLALNTLANAQTQLARIKAIFENELQEGTVLVGREVMYYTVTPESITNAMNEDRVLQEERMKKIERIKIRLEDMGGGAGDDVLKEYEEATERDAFLEREIEDLEKSAESLQVLIDDLAKKLAEEFDSGIQKINTQFHDFFTLMFGGGAAKVFIVEEKKRRRKLADDLLGETDEEEEEVEKGIEVDIALPHKKTKGLMMLSGGERALTSIALLFAISQVNPPPFVILDETDAALDEANSRKYGDMIEKLAENSQLILITHNRETMSRAGVLYGITMGGDGISKLLSVKFDEAVAVAK